MNVPKHKQVCMLDIYIHMCVMYKFHDDIQSNVKCKYNARSYSYTLINCTASTLVLRMSQFLLGVLFKCV